LILVRKAQTLTFSTSNFTKEQETTQILTNNLKPNQNPFCVTKRFFLSDTNQIESIRISDKIPEKRNNLLRICFYTRIECLLSLSKIGTANILPIMQKTAKTSKKASMERAMALHKNLHTRNPNRRSSRIHNQTPIHPNARTLKGDTHK
jgi:hypothetical protein